MSIATTEVLEAAEPSPRDKKRLLIALLAVVLLLVAAGAVWFLLLAPDAEAAEEPIVEGEIVSLEPQTTTLGDAEVTHARVALAVVLAEGVDPQVVPAKTPLLQDALLRELATMDATSIRSAEGSDLLRERLSAEAREIWEEGEVVRVVLTELLVQ